MRYFSFFAAAALSFSAATATAQTRMSMTNVESAIKALLHGVAAKANNNGGLANMNSATTKPTQTTNYVYKDNSWKFSSTTKTEYNRKGYVTATETTGTDGAERVEYTYDDSLDGFVTKTTSYSWDEASKSWTNPVVTSQVELTKNDKGRVTKEIVYSYDEDTKTMEKEMEVNFEYALIGGKLYKISTTIEQDGDDGENISIPVSITILKWHKYNENKLFSFSLDGMENGFLSDSDNQIESATITMTMPIMGMNLPVTGTIKGTYEDTKTNMEVNMSALGQSLMKMVTTVNITDQYGSSETNISMDSMGEYALTAKTVSTNNEHGDCIKTETTGTVSEDLGDITGGGDTDISADDLNQSTTYDYEYYTLPDNTVLKKSMTTNVKDNTSGEYKPTAKIDYWGYIDYASETTGIQNTMQNSSRMQNKAIYGINGEKMNNIPSNAEKSVYILKEGGKTIKIAK